MLPIGPPSVLKNPWTYFKSLVWSLSDKEKDRVQRQQDFLKSGTGYLSLQSSKPRTLGYGLADSPAFLLAWIWEKLHGWSDNYPWTDDEILTWVCIYWFSTAGPAASSRIYFEYATAHDPDLPQTFTNAWIPRVKYGITHMPKEIVDAPGLWASVIGDVVYESEAEFGGHFAAWENPEFIAQDLKRMFRQVKFEA